MEITNQTDATTSQEKQRNYWNQSEQEELIKTLAIVIRGQKTFAEQSVKDAFAYFKMKLEKRFTVEQVINAIDIWTDKSREVPVPADIIAILQPEPKQITQAEFIHAQKVLDRAGYYNSYSPEAILIREYKAQQEEERAPLHDQPMHPRLAERLRKELGTTPKLKRI